jgi:hypothetical protein
VLSTEWMDYNGLLKLKDIEHLVETYYNSGRFANALNYIMNEHHISPFDFYDAFSQYWNEQGYYHSPKSISELYRILYEFVEGHYEMNMIFNELVKLDWLLFNKNSSMPTIIKRYDSTPLKDMIYAYIKNNEKFKQYMQDAGISTVKDLLKQIYYEVFFYDVTKASDTLGITLVFFLQDIKNPLSIEYFSIKDSELFSHT